MSLIPAQMASAMPAARAMLADIKPPIADAAIADSLWHYWFDVEKAVAWLRKDWEKKGEYPSESPTSLSSSMSMRTGTSTSRSKRMAGERISVEGTADPEER